MEGLGLMKGKKGHKKVDMMKAGEHYEEQEGGKKREHRWNQVANMMNSLRC